MLSVQPSNNVTFGYAQPKGATIDLGTKIAKGFSVAEIEAYRKANGISPAAAEAEILAKHNLTGRLPVAAGGAKFAGIPELSELYSKFESFFKNQ